MPRRLLKLVASSFTNKPLTREMTYTFSTEDIVWVMGSFCALNRKPFDAELLTKQFPPPYTSDSFIHAARALGFKIKRLECSSKDLPTLSFPCLVVLNETVIPAQSTESVVMPDVSNEMQSQGDIQLGEAGLDTTTPGA
jgi:subfamily B ATP-binding cassette protein HlyB/CyaB